MFSIAGGAVITGLTLWNMANYYVPAHRGYVQEYVKMVQAATDNRAVKIERSLLETQIQVNAGRRASLRKEQFDLELKLKDPTLDNQSRSLVTQRKNAVDDDLDEANRELQNLRTRGSTDG